MIGTVSDTAHTQCEPHLGSGGVETAPEGVGGEGARVAEDVEGLACPGRCNAHAVWVGEEPNPALGVASHAAEDDDVGLAALRGVDCLFISF